MMRMMQVGWGSRDENVQEKDTAHTTALTLPVSGLHKEAIFSGAPLQYTSMWGSPIVLVMTLIRWEAEENGNCRMMPTSKGCCRGRQVKLWHLTKHTQTRYFFIRSYITFETSNCIFLLSLISYIFNKLTGCYIYNEVTFLSYTCYMPVTHFSHS